MVYTHLLLINLAYFLGLHLLGVIGLIPWIQYANPKYRAWLEECGQNKIWWYFFPPFLEQSK